jgi:hypothetical protein
MGPWRIVESLPGVSYAIEFVNKPSRRDKKHAANLSPYPPELISFKPLESADSRYGQLYKPNGKSPHKEAGIEGFKLPCPFQLASHFVTKGDYRDFHFPTLAELNKEVCPFLWIDNNKRIQLMSRDEIEDQPALYTGPPPSRAVPSPPSAPPLGLLVASIINSSDHLFFILHLLGNPNTFKIRGAQGPVCSSHTEPVLSSELRPLSKDLQPSHQAIVSLIVSKGSPNFV